MSYISLAKLKITIDRKTGKELSKELIGTDVMDEELYYDNLIRLLTGMGQEQLYEAIIHHYYGNQK